MKTKTIIFLSNPTAYKHIDALVSNHLGAEKSYKQGNETSYESSGDETSLLVPKCLSA
jgi:hypothetical protein